jgi:dihydroxyacid dehydratase/phosphogluconate dehydratase
MNKQRIIATLGMVSALVRNNITRGGSSNIGYHLPEIAKEDRIRVNTPKIRKHATKWRINKLYDKKFKK